MVRFYTNLVEHEFARKYVYDKTCVLRRYYARPAFERVEYISAVMFARGN